MAHPFAKMFDAALRKSSPDDFDNRILLVAEDLKKKGYRDSEIHMVLEKFAKGLIDPKDAAAANEALEEFSRHLDA
jgi:hypothetical protein